MHSQATPDRSSPRRTGTIDLLAFLFMLFSIAAGLARVFFQPW
jgi:hypothetical protein